MGVVSDIFIDVLDHLAEDGRDLRVEDLLIEVPLICFDDSGGAELDIRDVVAASSEDSGHYVLSDHCL